MASQVCWEVGKETVTMAVSVIPFAWGHRFRLPVHRGNKDDRSAYVAFLL